jgi:hypothetical protein
MMDQDALGSHRKRPSEEPVTPKNMNQAMRDLLAEMVKPPKPKPTGRWVGRSWVGNGV